MKPTLCVPFCLLLITAAARSQDQGQPAAKPGDAITAALRSHLGGATVAWRGRVTRKSAGADEAAAGIMVVSGAASAEPFHGAVDVVCRGDRTLVVSKSDLPSVVVFDDGSTRVTRTTVGADPIDAGTLARDLPDLLRAERLLRECETAEWQVEPAADGGRRATARLRKTLIQAVGGGGPTDFLSKKVDRVLAAVTLDRDGKVTALDLTVVRFDPNAVMRRRVIENGGAGGMQTVTPADLEIDDSDRSEADYEQDVYELRPAAAEVDARLQQLWDEMAAVARKDGF